MSAPGDPGVSPENFASSGPHGPRVALRHPRVAILGRGRQGVCPDCGSGALRHVIHSGASQPRRSHCWGRRRPRPHGLQQPPGSPTAGDSRPSGRRSPLPCAYRIDHSPSWQEVHHHARGPERGDKFFECRRTQTRDSGSGTGLSHACRVATSSSSSLPTLAAIAASTAAAASAIASDARATPSRSSYPR